MKFLPMHKNFTDNTTFAGLNNEAVTISDTTLDAAKLKYVEDKTSGDVTVSATTITGLVADVKLYMTKKVVELQDLQELKQ